MPLSEIDQANYQETLRSFYQRTRETIEKLKQIKEDEQKSYNNFLDHLKNCPLSEKIQLLSNAPLTCSRLETHAPISINASTTKSKLQKKLIDNKVQIFISKKQQETDGILTEIDRDISILNSFLSNVAYLQNDSGKASTCDIVMHSIYEYAILNISCIENMVKRDEHEKPSGLSVEQILQHEKSEYPAHNGVMYEYTQHTKQVFDQMVNKKIVSALNKLFPLVENGTFSEGKHYAAITFLGNSGNLEKAAIFFIQFDEKIREIYKRTGNITNLDRRDNILRIINELTDQYNTVFKTWFYKTKNNYFFCFTQTLQSHPRVVQHHSKKKSPTQCIIQESIVTAEEGLYINIMVEMVCNLHELLSKILGLQELVNAQLTKEKQQSDESIALSLQLESETESNSILLEIVDASLHKEDREDDYNSPTTSITSTIEEDREDDYNSPTTSITSTIEEDVNLLFGEFSSKRKRWMVDVLTGKNLRYRDLNIIASSISNGNGSRKAIKIFNTIVGFHCPHGPTSTKEILPKNKQLEVQEAIKTELYIRKCK